MKLHGRRPEETTLTVWQVVELARHPDRPYSLDYFKRMAPDFVEMHGDRISGDDPALIGGVGTWHGRTTMFLGHQKGRSLKERVARNWGMMHPEGYRKAIRLAQHAAKFNFPIISLIDTPGAYPGAGAEERGIASAIAKAIMEWFRIPVPIVAAVIGEGGSGGALGMGVADRVIMLENSIYSVASPEAAASIVWRDNTRKVEAAEQLQLTSRDLLAMGVVFQVPVLILGATRLGLVTPRQLRRARRYALLACATVAAFLPGDAVTLVLETVPLYVLYEASILLASFIKPVGGVEDDPGDRPDGGGDSSGGPPSPHDPAQPPTVQQIIDHVDSRLSD